MDIWDTKARNVSFKVYLALKIIDEVVPYIIGNKDIMSRVSRAYAWYVFLCRLGRRPDVKSDNYREWDTEDLKKIVDELVNYAKDIIEAFV